MSTQTHEIKTLVSRFSVKAVDMQARTFKGLASTWDLDLGGDVILPGAFKKTLAKWKAGGPSIKLFYGHNYFEMGALLGKMVEGEETKDGLLSEFYVTPGPTGDQGLAHINSGVLDSMSIGYEAVSIEYPDDAEQRKGIRRYLKEIDLHEVSVVPFPMNPAALISGAKASLDRMDSCGLNDDHKRDLRVLASRIGHLLRDLPEEKAETPDAPPDEAVAPKADEAPDTRVLDRLLVRRIQANF
jgi:HK97 family phage prohead protease